MDQHNEEHTADRDSRLSCQIKWQRGWLLETGNKQALLICAFVPASTQRWGSLWGVEQLTRFQIEDGCFEPHFCKEWKLPIHILCLYVLNLCWQTLWLHIIRVISLYFYAADGCPCQQAPWQSKMENPPSFKVLHMSLPSLLSFPLHTPTQRIPWDTVPRPILMVGKLSMLVHECVCVPHPNVNVFWNNTAGTKGHSYFIYLFVFFVVDLMTHLSSKMDWDPGTPSESLRKDTNRRWLIGSSGQWLVYLYHHWCNMIKLEAELELFHLCSWGEKRSERNNKNGLLF